MVQHPLCYQRPAARDDFGDARLDQRHKGAQHAAVHGHIIHSLPRLALDDFQQVVGREIEHGLHHLHGFVDGHSADRHRGMADDRFANGMDILPGGKVHHRIGAVAQADTQLLQLFLDAAGECGVADVGIDLAAHGGADGGRFQLEVVNIGGNDQSARRHFIAYAISGYSFARGDDGHLFRNAPLAGVMHLGDDAGAALHPFSAW